MKMQQSGQKGFTLIETLVALGIAAVALTTLAGRLGLSADTQRSLIAHSTMLEVARNVLEQERSSPAVDLSDRDGKETVRGMEMTWRLSTEKTEEGFIVRQNILVSYEGEPDVALFLYHVK